MPRKPDIMPIQPQLSPLPLPPALPLLPTLLRIAALLACLAPVCHTCLARAPAKVADDIPCRGQGQLCSTLLLLACLHTTEVGMLRGAGWLVACVRSLCWGSRRVRAQSSRGIVCSTFAFRRRVCCWRQRG